MIKDIKNHDRLSPRADDRVKRWRRWLLKKQLLSGINEQLAPEREARDNVRRLMGIS